MSVGTPNHEERPLLPALFTQRMSLLTAFASVLSGLCARGDVPSPGPSKSQPQRHVYDGDVLCDHPVDDVGEVAG